MRNFRQDGSRMRYTAGADITSGDVVVVGSRIGIATADIANGAVGELAMEGVFELAKKSADTFTQGAVVYWDNTNDELTTTSTDNTLAGYVTEAAASSVVLAKIKINA